jgi:hypothetical protein
MRVRVEIYQVWGQDFEGRERHAYHFTDVVDACAFAVANEGRIACRLPVVIKVITGYDTKDLVYPNVGECYYELSDGEIRSYARELKQ